MYSAPRSANSWLRFPGGAAEGEMRGESGSRSRDHLGKGARAARGFCLPGAEQPTHGALCSTAFSLRRKILLIWWGRRLLRKPSPAPWRPEARRRRDGGSLGCGRAGAAHPGPAPLCPAMAPGWTGCSASDRGAAPRRARASGGSGGAGSGSAAGISEEDGGRLLTGFAMSMRSDPTGFSGLVHH